EPIKGVETGIVPALHSFEIPVPTLKKPVQILDHRTYPLVLRQTVVSDVFGFDRPLCLQAWCSLSDGCSKSAHGLAAHLLTVPSCFRVTKVMETQKLETRRHRHDAGFLRVQTQPQWPLQYLAGQGQ